MNTNITKRNFLQSIGAVAGVSAVYRTMQALGMMESGVSYASQLYLPNNSSNGNSVVILGAGISGLTAAYELSKAGYQCTILEATARAGGRSLTVRSGDQIEEVDSKQSVNFGHRNDLYANLGPARIPYHHRALLNYCKQFEIELEVFTNDNRAALFHNQNRFGGKPVAGRRAKTDLRGYISELLVKAVDQKALDSHLSSEDKEKILPMLKAYGSLNEDYLYKNADRGGYQGKQLNAGLKAGQLESQLDFSELLSSEFWHYKLHFSEFLDQNPTLFQPVGGMDAIVKAFEKRVGSLIHYQSVVTEIRKSANGVRIVYQSVGDGETKEIQADFAICSIPAPVLVDIPNDFSPDVQKALESIKFVSAVKIALETRRRFWEDDYAIYGGISWTDQDITQIWYPAQGYHQPNGVLIGAYIWDENPGVRYSDMPPRERLNAAIAEGEQIHPGYSKEITAGVSRAWRKAPFQKGGWPAGYQAPDSLQKPDGANFFVGDQVTALPGWQEGAILAAHAAVNQISERVMKN